MLSSFRNAPPQMYSSSTNASHISCTYQFVTIQNTPLPRHLRNNTFRIASNNVLSSFVKQQDSHTKSHWEEPVLRRDDSRLQYIVEALDVQEEYGYHQGEGNSGQQKPIHAVLQNRKATRPDSEEIEPGHDVSMGM